MPESIESRFRASARAGDVSSLLLRPDDAERLLVLAHGAGAGMHHGFLEGIAERLAARRVATFRYQFPYMERRSRRPDPPAVLVETVRYAVTAAREAAEGLPLLAGGKSLGGRMTSTAASEGELPGVEGLVFFGFPLHPPGRPGRTRAAHLADVLLPMLFLQGTRDDLADLSLLRPVCEELGPRATLRIVDGADHSFRIPTRSARGAGDPLDELADATREWAALLG
jgi:predicted alpha/beta-hydrolase family hydrolase